MVSGSEGKFSKPYNKSNFEEGIEIFQVNVNFRLASLVQREGKSFQDKALLCANIQRHFWRIAYS